MAKWRDASKQAIDLAIADGRSGLFLQLPWNNIQD
jgi:hypothetical protein